MIALEIDFSIKINIVRESSIEGISICRHIVNINNHRMLNHAAGRYLAWRNLSELFKSSLRKYSPGPTYQFKYVPPKTTVRAKLLPFDQWKGNKQRQQSQFNLVLLSLAVLALAAGRMCYLILYDDYLGYLYQVKYPILSRTVELLQMDIAELTDPFFDIVPKDRYQVPQILPRLYEMIVQKQKRIADADRKVMELRKQLEEFDKKYK